MVNTTSLLNMLTRVCKIVKPSMIEFPTLPLIFMQQIDWSSYGTISLDAFLIRYTALVGCIVQCITSLVSLYFDLYSKHVKLDKQDMKTWLWSGFPWKVLYATYTWWIIYMITLIEWFLSPKRICSEIAMACSHCYQQFVQWKNELHCRSSRLYRRSSCSQF